MRHACVAVALLLLAAFHPANAQSRGPVAYPHPYIPDDAKIVSFATVSDELADKLETMWRTYILGGATQRTGTR